MAKKAKVAAAEEVRPNADPDKISAAYVEYASMRRDQARLGQRIAAMLAREEKGNSVDPKALKAAYKAAQQDPRDALVEERRAAEYKRIIGVIEVEESGQTTLAGAFKLPKLSDVAQANLTRHRAHSDGYNTGFAGGEVSACRHAPGSEDYVHWRDGWQEGHADRIAKNPALANETVPAARKPGRGRPPGAVNKPKLVASSDGPSTLLMGDPVGSA